MDFERFENLQGQLITLDCAFMDNNMRNEHNELDALMKRLSLWFDTDETIENDCVNFLKTHEAILEKFKTKYYRRL